MSSRFIRFLSSAVGRPSQTLSPSNGLAGMPWCGSVVRIALRRDSSESPLQKSVPAAIAVLLFAVALVPLARSQSPSPVAAAATTTSADSDWQQLKQNERATSATTKTGSRPLASSGGKTLAAATLSPVAADYLAQADQLRDFRSSHPDDVRIGEARRQEALMLVNAQFYSAEIDTDRCDQLVAQARKDISLPAEDRFSLASSAENQKLIFQQYASETMRLARFEETARALIEEFPTVPQAYEALLNLAKSCPDDQAHRIAADLLKMNSPAVVKDGAQPLGDRCALVGQPLENILSAALSAKAMPSLAKNNIVILYGWSATNEGGFLIAKEIAAKAPVGASILGINLDADTGAAKKVATARGLPGIQLYDPAGSTSKLAQALKLNLDAVVIVADRQGVVTTVSGQRNLVEAIASANQ